LLVCLVKTADMAAALRPRLLRLSEQPTAAESAEELDAIASDILNKRDRLLR